MTEQKRGERQKDSVYTKRYMQKRQTHRVELHFYADDAEEAVLIEKIKDLQAKKQLKTIAKQSLIEYFAKHSK